MPLDFYEVKYLTLLPRRLQDVPFPKFITVNYRLPQRFLATVRRLFKGKQLVFYADKYAKFEASYDLSNSYNILINEYETVWHAGTEVCISKVDLEECIFSNALLVFRRNYDDPKRMDGLECLLLFDVGREENTRRRGRADLCIVYDDGIVSLGLENGKKENLFPNFEDCQYLTSFMLKKRRALRPFSEFENFWQPPNEDSYLDTPYF